MGRQVPMEYAPALRPKNAEQGQPEKPAWSLEDDRSAENGHSLNAYV